MIRPQLAISSCLLGQKVRYDGGDKQNIWLTRRLSPLVEWSLICPEVELGLGVPRETIDLELVGEQTLLLGGESRRDLTQAMTEYATARVAGLQQIDGYVLKSKSPSCALTGAKLITPDGVSRRPGLFASILTRELPWLPAMEESSISDEEVRVAFLSRVFAFARLRGSLQQPSLAALQQLHRQHRLLLLAHSPAQYEAMQRLLFGGDPPDALAQRYTEHFREALSQDATREGHTAALRHGASYFHGALSGAGRAAVHQRIEAYQERKIGLLEVLRFVAREAKRCKITYLTEQVYCAPYPEELTADLAPG